MSIFPSITDLFPTKNYLYFLLAFYHLYMILITRRNKQLKKNKMKTYAPYPHLKEEKSSKVKQGNTIKGF